MILYSVGMGFGGLYYSLIIPKAWEFFPGKEGLVSGAIQGGFGVGGLVTTYLSTGWVNTNSVNA